MTQEEIKKLKEAAELFLKNWKKSGGKTGKYECGHCCQENETVVPDFDPSDVRNFWDSIKVCTLCGKLNFVTARAGGKVTCKKA